LPDVLSHLTGKMTALQGVPEAPMAVCECFTLRPLCMQYLLIILRPWKDVPWHKAYIFLRLLSFTSQKHNYIPSRCLLFCSQFLEKGSSREI
jgi:hypothetical protein